MKPTRRDLFTLGAGLVAGLPFTPIPWKLLDDVSIWSQNWPWIPTPQRGEPGVVCTHCTLCAAGCGMKVRTVAGRPVSIARVAEHPLCGGALCALALGSHQMAWHPARLKQALSGGQPVALDEALKQVAAKLAPAGTKMAFLDARPGRVASQLYAKFSAGHGGLYLAARRVGQQASQLLARWSGSNEPLGVDLEHARTLVSFGVPVFEGAVAPGRLLALWKQHKLRVIQVEARHSVSAALADEWLAIEPGSESVLAQALAGTIAPKDAVQATGVSVEGIRRAVEMVADGPTIVLGDEPNVIALNAKLANVGKPGGFLARRPLPLAAGASAPKVEWLEEVPDGSLDVLMVEGEAAAAEHLRGKLKAGGTLVVFSAYRAGLALNADIVLPVPAVFETWDEVATAPDATRASFALAAAVGSAPAGVEPAHRLLGRLSGWADNAYDEALNAQVAAIQQSRRGDVFFLGDGTSRPLKEIESAAKLRECLNAGACWVDEAAATALKCTLPDKLPAAGPPGEAAWLESVLPPLASKIYQESTLRKSGEV